jgi:hypothetical protein
MPAAVVAIAAVGHLHVFHAALVFEGIPLPHLRTTLWWISQLLAPHLVLWYLRRQASLRATAPGFLANRRLTSKHSCAAGCSQQHPASARQDTRSVAGARSGCTGHDGPCSSSTVPPTKQHQAEQELEHSDGDLQWQSQGCPAQSGEDGCGSVIGRAAGSPSHPATEQVPPVQDSIPHPPPPAEASGRAHQDSAAIPLEQHQSGVLGDAGRAGGAIPQRDTAKARTPFPPAWYPSCLCCACTCISAEP